jgi:protoporphyrinogen oxidase
VSDRSFVVVGGGPAGLTAALQLTRFGVPVTVVERTQAVGGIARTEEYKGFHFDMGGHRFFTKRADVHRLWEELLPGDFLRRPRLSRIYYRGRFFHYPLKPVEALLRLGPLEALRIVLSYLRWQAFPHRREETFEQWVTNRFGRRLFETFFKAYTEKVWGLSCSELRAEWAAQRIKNLSLRSILVSFLVPPRQTITSLIEEFHYPRRGPGMMWRAAARDVEARGGVVRLDSDVTRIVREGTRIVRLEVRRGGGLETIEGTDFITSMPVTQFVRRLDPPPPPEVLEAARRLRYRDLLTVCLIVNRPHLFPDNWIYVHDEGVKVARIQNFKNWSPEMVPDPSRTSLGLEYFCDEGDAFWTLPDAVLVQRGREELEKIGLAQAADVEDGCVFRVPNAYPVYDSVYAGHLGVLRGFMDGLENCRTVGRNGLHRYNNQDHSMLTAMSAVGNMLFDESHDLWSVNTDAEYHEEVRTGPETAAVTELLERFDPVAMGLSSGAMSGALIALATLVLVMKGGPVVGPTLGLLAEYFPGYRVSGAGSLVGLFYGGALGFLGGWAFARIRNLQTALFLALARRQRDLRGLARLLE